MIQTLSVACDWNHIKNPTDTFGNRNWGNPNLRDRIIGIAMMILFVPFTLGIGTAYLLYTAHRKVEQVKNSGFQATFDSNKEQERASDKINAGDLPIVVSDKSRHDDIADIQSQENADLYVNLLPTINDDMLEELLIKANNFYIAKALLSRVVDEGYDYTAFCSKQSSFVFSGYTPEQQKALAETGIDLHAVTEKGENALDFEFEGEFANYLIEKGVQCSNNDDDSSSFDPDEFNSLDFDTP